MVGVPGFEPGDSCSRSTRVRPDFPKRRFELVLAEGFEPVDFQFVRLALYRAELSEQKNFGGRSQIRTDLLLFFRQTLIRLSYPTMEPRVRFELTSRPYRGRALPIELSRHIKHKVQSHSEIDARRFRNWSGRRDLNSRLLTWKDSTLASLSYTRK